MITDDIYRELIKLQDTGYRDMQVTIIPTVNADSIIGVRTPALRQLAKELSKREDISSFLGELPHKYFEENQLHAFILSGMKDAGNCIRLVTDDDNVDKYTIKSLNLSASGDNGRCIFQCPDCWAHRILAATKEKRPKCDIVFSNRKQKGEVNHA